MLKKRIVLRQTTLLAALPFLLATAIAVMPMATASAIGPFKNLLGPAAFGPKVPAGVGLGAEAAHPLALTALAAAPSGRARTSSSGASAPVTATPVSADDLAQARAVLAGYVAQYPILAGSTVTIGDAKGQQAISYPWTGRIIISPTHTASLSSLIGHEIWHIIDARDNGVIDWGENLPG